MGADQASAAARLAEVCPPTVRAALDHLHATATPAMSSAVGA